MKKIVIIDDEYFFRQALIKYVRSFKDEFTVVGDAGNGKLGIELIEQYHPEIILIDISMPQMTGFDVISYIQKQALQTRFIIISGYDKFEYAQKAIQMGVQDFLLKPVTVESLHKSLRQTSERIDQEVKKDQNLEVLDKKKRNYQNYMRHFAASQFVRKMVRIRRECRSLLLRWAIDWMPSAMSPYFTGLIIYRATGKKQIMSFTTLR